MDRERGAEAAEARSDCRRLRVSNQVLEVELVGDEEPPEVSLCRPEATESSSFSTLKWALARKMLQISESQGLVTRQSSWPYLSI